METATKLIISLKNINMDDSLNKQNKTNMKDGLEKLIDFTSKEDNKALQPVIDLLSKGRLSESDKEELIKSRKNVIKIITRYEEEYNELPNEDKLDDNLDEKTVEKLLDEKVPKYCGFSKTHPMEGIGYDKNKEKIRVKTEKINTYSKNLETATEKIKNSIDAKNQIFIENITRKVLINNNASIIKYIYNNMSYYDIRHIISILGLKPSACNKKYNDFDNKIKYLFWHKNEYNGYILRELISLNTVKRIIVSSNKSQCIRLYNLFGIKGYDQTKISKESSTIDKIITVFQKEKYIDRFPVGKYSVDLYFLDYNLVIECDEFNHSNRNQQYEKTRQKYIETKMNCTFIRYNPDDPDFNIFKVISDIYYHIVNYS